MEVKNTKLTSAPTPCGVGARPLDERLVRALRELAVRRNVKGLAMVAMGPHDALDSLNSNGATVQMNISLHMKMF